MKTISFFSFEIKRRMFLVFCQLLAASLVFTYSLFSMAQNGEIEEVVIYQEYIPDEKLETADIADLLDADDMSITGDSNVGEALKRLPGLSLVGGKFIYIRGLGDRYSSTYFNGALMPGLEPLKRAVPLDLFDSNVISNLLVQKTYSANYSSEFTGGAVDIRSAAIPDENGFEIKIKTGYNTASTGKTRLSYDGGSRGWTGYDDGTRELPSAIGSNVRNPFLFSNQDGLSALERDRLIFSFSEQNNVWEIDDKGSNSPDFGLSTALKRRWDDFDRVSIGLIGTLSYDHKWRNRIEKRFRWRGNLRAKDADISGVREIGSEDTIFDTVLRFGDEDVTSGPLSGQNNIRSSSGLSGAELYERTQRQVGLNGLLSLGVLVDDVHEYKVTKMLLRKSVDEASIASQGLEVGNFRVLERTRMIFEENEIDFSQLAGTHYLNDMTVNWRYSKVQGERNLPDERFIGRYSVPGQDAQNILGTDGGIDDRLNPLRTYTFVDDSTDDFGIDLVLPFTSNLIEEFEVKVGYSRLEKNRVYDAFRVRYDLSGLGQSDHEALFTTAELLAFKQQGFSNLADASGCTAGGVNSLTDSCYLNLTSSTDVDGAIQVSSGFSAPNSEYQGEIVSEAAYVIFDMNFSETFRLNLGLRREKYDLAAFAPANPRDPGASDLTPTLSSKGVYPSAKFTWNFAENMALRGAYSETQNRPNLNELIEVQLINTEDGNTYVGNSALEIADITSYDLRYEWYFGEQDYLSLTAFKKQIDNPIENAVDEASAGGEGLELTTWVNQLEAKNRGFELEIRKYFGEYFSVIANASDIDSKLKEEGVEGDRPLQGLSEKLYNAQLIYQNDVASVSLAWNYFSKRISAIQGVNNDRFLVIEQPRDTVDFNAKYNFYIGDGSLGLGFKVSNLLDEDSVETFESGLTYDKYEIGQTYSLSLSWKQ